MENDIPSGQNNPLNYFENWATAYEKINESVSGGKGKTGFMAYEDFYNIVTEMNNLVSLTGNAVQLGKDVEGNAMYLDGSLESAAALIERGAGALKVTANGDLKVDLSSIGVSFSSGATDLNKNVDAGIEALA